MSAVSALLMATMGDGFDRIGPSCDRLVGTSMDYSFSCPTGHHLVNLTMNADGTDTSSMEVYLMGGACSDGTTEGPYGPPDPTGGSCGGITDQGGCIGKYGCINRHKNTYYLTSSTGSGTVVTNNPLRLRHLAWGDGSTSYVGAGSADDTWTCPNGGLLAGWEIDVGCATDSLCLLCAPPVAAWVADLLTMLAAVGPVLCIVFTCFGAVVCCPQTSQDCIYLTQRCMRGKSRTSPT